MGDATAGATPSGQDDEFSEPDYENLDLSFHDLEEEEGEKKNHGDEREFLMEQQAVDLKAATSTSVDAFHSEEQMILGTLIVRVIAARKLESVRNTGLGGILFGNRNNTRNSGGSTNPYAVVRFGNTSQRTPEVFDSVDPVWPRGDSMYMDVMHPVYFQSESSDAAATGKIACKDDSNFAIPHRPPKPILTIALFHANQNRELSKYPNKDNSSGDSNDLFLGMTAVDLTQLLTGKIRTFDDWLPLSGSKSMHGTVRIACEYEASDVPPRPEDVVRFTAFVHPTDLYPAQANRSYKVKECDGDNVTIYDSTPEGWVTSYLVHRFMLICTNRHQGTVEFCQDELASVAERLAHSPLINTVQETVDRMPDEGLVSIGMDTFNSGTVLLSRWLAGGLQRAVSDVVYATNWDGQLNPNAEPSSLSASFEETDDSVVDLELKGTEPLNSYDLSSEQEGNFEPLPNMPSCPITGEPIRDPVVAADGHTYERSAIARWLKTSDKSPLTGSVLSHKNLVQNYMLLSSLQETATTKEATDSEEAADSDVTAEVQIE